MNRWQTTSVNISYTDFTSICRVCFARNNLRNLQEVEYLIDVLQSLTNTEIAEEDGMPQNVCVNCIKKLEEISDFIDLSKYNDSCLRQVYLTRSDIKTNTVTWSKNVYEDKVDLEIDLNKEVQKKKSTSISDINDNIINSNEYLSTITEAERENTKRKSADEHTTESDGSLHVECDRRYEKNQSRNIYMRRRYPNDEYVRHRREQNRKAAAKSRKKMKDRLMSITQTVEYLERANMFLKNQKQELETEISDLVKVLARFKCSKKHTAIKLDKEI